MPNFEPLFILMSVAFPSVRPEASQELNLESDLIYSAFDHELNTTYYTGREVNITVVYKVTVDLRAHYFIDTILARVSDFDGMDRVHATLHYYNKKDDVRNDCKMSKMEDKELIISCQKIGRIFKIYFISSMQLLSITGYDTFYDKLHGCYDLRRAIPTNEFHFSTLGQCLSDCSSFALAAVNQDVIKKCRCFSSTGEMILLNLSRCNSSCGSNEFQMCGSGSYFAVYLTDRTLRRQSETTWDCLDDYFRCPDCESGRFGTHCDTFDCNITNGNCKEMICQDYNEEPFMRETCVCPSGYIMDGDYKCKDYDECQNPNFCGHGQSSACNNSEGGFSCSCPEGYREDDGDLCISEAPTKASAEKPNDSPAGGDPGTNSDNHAENSADKSGKESKLKDGAPCLLAQVRLRWAASLLLSLLFTTA